MQEKRKKEESMVHLNTPAIYTSPGADPEIASAEEGRKPSGLGVHSAPPGSALARHPDQLQMDADLELVLP